MDAFVSFFHSVLSQLDKANFAYLAIGDFVAFVVVFVVFLLACALSNSLRARCRRAFFYLSNAFTAVTLAIFSIEFTAAQSVFAAAIFWCAAFLLCGVLCLFKDKKVTKSAEQAPVHTVSAMPVRTVQPVTPAAEQSPASQTVVRLEHALSIADKLLLKNLGRGDRQELEKMKTSLTVLKVKGILSAQEGEALNETFNALLKLMAKYDV